METIDFMTVVTIIAALELISFNGTVTAISYKIVERNLNQFPVRYRVYLKDDKKKYVSLFNDVSLSTGYPRRCNMVVERPAKSFLKTQISLTESLNPIILPVDQYGHEMLVIADHPEGSMPWNEGKLPQTWHAQEATSSGGAKFVDGDGPVTVIEIGGKTTQRGQVIEVDVLAAYETKENSSGRTGWILIGISSDIPKSIRTYNIQTMKSKFHSEWGKFEQWLKKTNRCLKNTVDAPEVGKLIEEKNEMWKKLQKTKKVETLNGVNLKNTTLKNDWTITQDEASKLVLKS